MSFARSWSGLSLALVLISATACGGDGSGGGDEPGDGGMPFEGGRASAMIGPEGGSLELGEMSLDIPPGALSEEMQIGVEAGPLEIDVEDFTPLSAAYVFSPSGLTFAVPVGLSFQLERGAAGAKLFHGEDEGAPPEVVADAEIRDRKVEAMISGFSYYVVGTSKETAPPIIDVDEGFEAEGYRYSAGPVGQGIIKGFSYSFADGAGVSDGESSNGHVWYDDDYCLTFRPDGTGVQDDAGGNLQRYNDFPWIPLYPDPGNAESVSVPTITGMDPAGGSQILDPEYDRAAELRPFRWGVRLNEDDTIYQSPDGYFLTRIEFEDGTWSSFHFDPETNTHAGFIRGIDEMTTVPPDDHHFCRFRETVSMTADGNQAICVPSIEDYGGGRMFMKSACYSHGVLEGPYSLTAMDGTEIISGQFANNRPVGGWSLRTLDGVMHASGSFSEDGVPQGEWTNYDYEGHIEKVATLKGGLPPSDYGGYYIVLHGLFQQYTTLASGSSYMIREGSLIDGKRSGPWHTFDEAGLRMEENFVLDTQLPSGEWCVTVPEVGYTCVPITRSWRDNSIHYDWGNCVGGVFTWQHNFYDMNESLTSQTCYELLGTPQEPERGPMKDSCGSACSQ